MDIIPTNITPIVPTNNVRIYHTDINGIKQFVDIPFNIVDRYPDSPFYYYMTNHPTELLLFENICQNLNLDLELTFELFQQMCTVLVNDTSLFDVSLDIKKILRIFNLVDPITEYLETFYKNTYNLCRNGYHTLLFNKNTFYEICDENVYYNPIHKMISVHKDIIPVKIIYSNQCINPGIINISIYDGLPIYYKTAQKEYYLCNNMFEKDLGVDINKARFQMCIDTIENVVLTYADDISLMEVMCDRLFKVIDYTNVYVRLLSGINFDIANNTVQRMDKKFVNFQSDTDYLFRQIKNIVCDNIRNVSYKFDHRIICGYVHI